LFLPSQVSIGAVSHNCLQWFGGSRRSGRVAVRCRPEAGRGRLDRQAVVNHIPLSPGLLDVPEFGFPASIAKTSVPEVIRVHRSERVSIAAMKRISGSSCVQIA